MANKGTGDIGGPYYAAYPGTSQERGVNARNTPLKDGTEVSTHMGPTNLQDMLQFYFGEPTSSHANKGHARHSRW